MRTVRAADGTPDQDEKHFNMWGIGKIRPQEGTARLTVSLSHFLPDGRAESSSSEKELAYYVLSGSVTIKGRNDEENTLSGGDMIYIAPDEAHHVVVNGVNPASVLVIAVDVW